jgi:hypothetical protein
MAKGKFITHQLEGVEIGQRFKDGYLNATALSSAYKVKTGKVRKPYHWLENARTQETIKHLANAAGIPAASLVQVVEGRNGGTYLHPRLSVRFAIWLDDDFGLAVEDFILAHGRERSAYVAARDVGKVTRGIEADAIQRAGFGEPRYYISATQAVYRGLFGMSAEKLRESRGVPTDGNLRDYLTTPEIRAIELIEMVVPQIVESYRGNSFKGAYAEIVKRAESVRDALVAA